MIVKVLASGSTGNCYILKDSKGHELLLECGINIRDILRAIEVDKFEGCIISHGHKDHSLAKDDLKKYGFAIYDEFEYGQIYDIGHWKILPIIAYHNVKCYSFIIYSIVDKKKILFITDTAKINRGIADSKYDLFMIECNYSQNYIKEHFDEIQNDGYKNHLSLEYLCDWLETRKIKPKSLCLIHLSKSHKIERETAITRLKNDFSNLYVADKQITIEI